jgi:hypothetical protein
MAQGHCNRCHKIWTLETAQGVCRWCGKLATCQTTLTHRWRSIKSSSRRKQSQSNNDNGYGKLPEPYLTYYNVASRFTGRVPPVDQQDLLHNIILTLARANQHKPMSLTAMYRAAEHCKDHYWYEHFAITRGLDCAHCSKTQRRNCRKDCGNWMSTKTWTIIIIQKVF